MALALHKILVGVDATQLQNRVAYRSLHQHGDVASGHHLDNHLAHRNAQDVLGQGLVRHAFELAFQGFAPHQVHDQLEADLAPHGGLTKNGADVKQADTAHFQQVLQKVGAAPLDGGLVDAVKVHRVVCHQAVSA